MCDFQRDAAHYTTGQGNNCFGWDDAQRDTGRQLASKFVERFPDIARLGSGADWPYAGWYVQMLGLAERGEFPIAYADWFSKPPAGWLPTTAGFVSGLPMPPAGEGSPSAAPDAAENGGD